MGNYRRDLSKMLRTVRQSCGLSQAVVASGLGVHRATYSYYEEGRTTPSIETLVTLGKIFDIPPEAFLYPEEFQSVQAARIKPSLKDCWSIEHLGYLNPEEQELIVQLRSGRLA